MLQDQQGLQAQVVQPVLKGLQEIRAQQVQPVLKDLREAQDLPARRQVLIHLLHPQVQ